MYEENLIFLFISVPVALCADALLVRCAPPRADLAPPAPVARWVGGGAAGGPRVLHRATRHRLPALIHAPAIARSWIYKDILRIKKDFLQFCQKRDLFIRRALIYVCYYTRNFAKGLQKHLLTINVPLFKKLRDIIFFLRDNYFLSHFEGHFEGTKTFLTP
jgi:hypothetical protein